MSDSKKLLNLSVSPHIRQADTVSSVMLAVVLALVPSFVASVYFFGTKAIMLTAVSAIFAMLTEWLIVKFLLKRESTLGDYSALVTGILFAYNLPPDLPLWMAAVGAVFSISVAKWAFGGLGNNFINPALAGRAFLMASYPAAMTSFSATVKGSISGIDSITSATPLKVMRFMDVQPLDIQSALSPLFWGNVGGVIGETSAFALLIGAIYLVYRRIIGLRIPLSYIGTVFILFLVFNGTGSGVLSSEALIIATAQVLAGGLILGAFFMATDMVTSPITPLGKVVFGVGCGVLTFIIRKFGGYPEGVSYSILLMNIVTPLIDRYTRPKIYGKVKK